MRASIGKRLASLESRRSQVVAAEKGQWFGVDLPVILRAMDDDTLDRLEEAQIAWNQGPDDEEPVQVMIECICDGYRAYCEGAGIDPVACEATIEAAL